LPFVDVAGATVAARAHGDLETIALMSGYDALVADAVAPGDLYTRAILIRPAP
jgi:hypothetical protein